MKRHQFALTFLLFVSCAGTLCAEVGVPERKQASGFQWGSALGQSGAFLAIQHGYRIADQPYTRHELCGPFLRDWFRSVKGLSGWDDGDSYLANYVGHPMEGAVAGYIQIHNDPGGMFQEFGGGKEYWQSRLRAMAWRAAFSTQYEIGPLGEAAIGNVGKTPGTKGMVDLVITPTLGTTLLVLEDVVDRHVVLSLETKTQNRWLKVFLRSMLNPDRSFANLLRWRCPWHRDTRPGIFSSN